MRKYFEKHDINDIGIHILALIGAFCIFSAAIFGCSGDGYSTNNGSAPYVAGLYNVTSGSQHVIDSWGNDELVDLAGMNLIAGVAQDGEVVEFFGCMGKLIENVARCDSDAFGLDTMFGAYYKRTQGKMTFKDKTLEVKILLDANFSDADYSGTNELELQATLDEERTDEATGGG